MSKLYWSFDLQLIKFGQKEGITAAKIAGNEDETHSVYKIATTLFLYFMVSQTVLLHRLNEQARNTIFENTIQTNNSE